MVALDPHIRWRWREEGGVWAFVVSWIALLEHSRRLKNFRHPRKQKNAVYLLSGGYLSESDLTRKAHQ